MSAPAESPVLDLVVSRAELPPDGMDSVFDAPAEVLEALAGRYGLSAVSSLRWTLDIAPWRRRGVAVRGRLEALIVQQCVVTLEPVETQIDEAIDERFDEVEPEAADADNAPEPMVDGRADVGTVLEQYFAMGIDPYPRKPGIDFEGFSTSREEGAAERPNPFAALKDFRGKR